MRTRLAVSLLAIVASVPALARDVEASSTITAVTVYPDAALIRREAAVDLSGGVAQVAFRGLPRSLDPASLQVSGWGTGFTITAVETRPSIGQKRDSSPVHEKLDGLKDARAALQVTIDALDMKQKLIERFSEGEPGGNPIAVKDWNAAFETFGAARAKVGEELRVARVKAQKIDEEIAQAQSGGHGLQGGAQDVVVAIDVAAAGKATVALEYKVADAHWIPAYEARLDTGAKDRKPHLELTRRALVSQHTGEDWSNVPLTVTTLRIQHTAAAPEVTPHRLSFAEAKPVVAERDGSGSEADIEGGTVRGRVGAPPAGLVAGGRMRLDYAVPASVRTADLDSGAYQASYRVPQNVSVASDNAQKSFVLSSQKLEPALSIHVSPSIDATGYLQARFKNEDAAPMLSGRMSVLRDGVYVGAATIAFVAPGEEADIGFGADDKVKVTQTSLSRREDEPGWLDNSRSKTRDVNTAVKNLHDFPVHVEIRDRVPAAENSQIVVETLFQTTKPSQPTIAGKPGVMEWALDLAPQEAKDVRLAWRVKWPAERELVEPADITSYFRFSDSTHF